MQGIFDKFSLQNLLRQFFCEFVFIASFWFFAGDNPADDKLHTLLDVEKWISVRLILLGIAACIIGIIIYHLGKICTAISRKPFLNG